MFPILNLFKLIKNCLLQRNNTKLISLNFSFKILEYIKQKREKLQASSVNCFEIGEDVKKV